VFFARGILAQAKNGNGVGGGEGIFFIFPWLPMCSHYIPLSYQWFPLGSQNVPNVFSNTFSIAPHFYPICFGKCCPPFTYTSAPKGRNSIFQK
jgi:hypothetical protein